MSAVLNDRDAILQAATVRIVNPKNAWINLQASAPGFHLNAAGQVDLAVVTVTADLVGLDDAVVFSAVGATLSNAAGRKVDVTYGGQTAIVTATVVSNGDEFKRSLIIPVLRDGASGAGTPGAPGARGAGHYYATGSTWSDIVAQAACPGSTPVLNDVVTISSSTYVMEKRWTGSVWIENGVVIPGNLIVPGSVLGSALKAGTVEIRKPDGTLLLGAGGEFGATVKVSNLEVSGSSDNIIPDPRFKDLAWWGRVGSAVGQFAEQGMVTDWKGGASLYLSQNAGELISYGQFFDLVPGATYRIEVQVALSNDFNGRASVYLTIPGDRDYAMVDRDSGLRWSDNMVVQLTNNSPKGVISYSTTYTIPASGTLSKGRIQIRNSHTAGNVEVGSVSITRMADSSLVVKRGIKADNIDVDRLAAIIAYLGNVELGAGGAVRQGKPGYGAGKGIWLGDHNGTPKLDIGETGGAGIIWDGFDLTINRPKLASPFSVTLSNVRITQQVNGSTIQFSAPKTINSGSGNYAYSWAFSVNGGGTFMEMISSPAAADAVIKATGSNRWIYGYLALTLKDLNSGLTATSSCELVVQFGSAVEP